MQFTSHLDVEKDSIWLLGTKPPFEKELPFVVREIGHFIAKPGYVANHVDKDGYLLLYTTEGEGTLQCGEDRYALKPGSVVYFDRSQHHQCLTAGNESWCFYWLHLHGMSCRFYHETMFGKRFAVVQAGPSLEPYFKSILANFETPSRQAFGSISNDISGILTKTVNLHHTHSDDTTPHLTAIEKTIQYMRERFYQPIEVGELAEMAKLSKYYYIKMFRDVMHTTPYEYLLQYRINESRKLLRSTSYKASEIAKMVGFADECNFSRTFKRLTGTTPLQYRKSS